MIGNNNTYNTNISNITALLKVNVLNGAEVTASKSNIVLTPVIWTNANDQTCECAIFLFTPDMLDAHNAWIITATTSDYTLS